MNENDNNVKGNYDIDEEVNASSVREEAEATGQNGFPEQSEQFEQNEPIEQDGYDEYEEVEDEIPPKKGKRKASSDKVKVSGGSKLPLILLIAAAAAIAGILIGLVVFNSAKKNNKQANTSAISATDDFTTVSANSITSLTDEEVAKISAEISSQAQQSAGQSTDQKSQLQIQGTSQAEGVIANYEMRTENSSYFVPVYDFGTIGNYVTLTDESQKAYEEAKKLLDTAKGKNAYDAILSHENYFMAAEPADLGIADKHYAYGETETGKTESFYVFQSLSTKDQGMVYGIIRVKVKNDTDEILATDDCTIVECVY